METYQITMAKREDYYSGNQAAVDSAPVFIIEAESRSAVHKLAFQTLNDESETVYLACGLKKVPSKKKVQELLSNGAKDLR